MSRKVQAAHSDELADRLREVLHGYLSEDKMKATLSNDPAFIKKLSQEVVERLIDEGYIEDKLLSLSETMALLGIKSRITMYKLRHAKKNPLVAVQMHANSRPKYRMSDINRYIKNLKK
jgi:hypothetical protein